MKDDAVILRSENMTKYLISGKLRKTEFSGFFLETETDADLLPLGFYLNDIFDSIPQYAKVTITIDYDYKLK